MNDTGDFHVVAAHAVGDDVGQVADDQLASAEQAARVSDRGILG